MSLSSRFMAALLLISIGLAQQTMNCSKIGNIGGACVAIASNDTLLIHGRGGEIVVSTFRDTWEPVEQTSMEMSGIVRHLHLSGSTLFDLSIDADSLTGMRRLRVLEVQQDLTLELLCSTIVDREVYDLKGRDGICYLACGDNGLLRYDASESGSISYLDSLGIAAYGICFSDTMMFVAAANEGLYGYRVHGEAALTPPCSIRLQWFCQQRGGRWCTGLHC